MFLFIRNTRRRFRCLAIFTIIAIIGAIVNTVLAYETCVFQYGWFNCAPSGSKLCCSCCFCEYYECVTTPVGGAGVAVIAGNWTGAIILLLLTAYFYYRVRKQDQFLAGPQTELNSVRYQ